MADLASTREALLCWNGSLRVDLHMAAIGINSVSHQVLGQLLDMVDLDLFEACEMVRIRLEIEGQGWRRRNTLCCRPGLPEKKTLSGAVKECVVILEQMLRVAFEDCSGSRLLQQRVRISAEVPACVDQAVIGIELDHSRGGFPVWEARTDPQSSKCVEGWAATAQRTV